MIERDLTEKLRQRLQKFPAVGVLGARQVGKTTLVRELLGSIAQPFVFIDAERPSDRRKIEVNPEFFLEMHRDKLVVIDEVQHLPALFPLLRAEIDEKRKSGRFLLLGSGSPELLRQSSESLAGRISYLELGPLNLLEVPADWQRLWLLGGFPEIWKESLNPSDAQEWLQAYIANLIGRDLPMMGWSARKLDLFRFISMLAFLQGQPENASELSRSLGVSQPTVKNAIDFLEHAFLIQRLPAWHTNLPKRMVKVPRLYFRDTGLLHQLLHIASIDELLAHPIAGHSFEGFIINQCKALLPTHWEMYFYRTQDGTEADIVLVKANKVRFLVEVKLGASEKVTKSMRQSMRDLQPDKLVIVGAKEANFMLDEQIQVLGPSAWVTFLSSLK